MAQIKRIVFVLTAAGAVFLNFTLAWATLAAANQLGWLAYPAYYGATMLLFNLTHLVLLPIGEKRGFGFKFLDRYLSFDVQRLSKWPWPQLRRRGSFAVNAAVMFTLGPIFFALSVRILGLSQHRVWSQAFLAAAITTAVWVTLYLGLVTFVWNAFLGVI